MLKHGPQLLHLQPKSERKGQTAEMNFIQGSVPFATQANFPALGRFGDCGEVLFKIAALHSVQLYLGPYCLDLAQPLVNVRKLSSYYHASQYYSCRAAVAMRTVHEHSPPQPSLLESEINCLLDIRSTDACIRNILFPECSYITMPQLRLNLCAQSE